MSFEDRNRRDKTFLRGMAQEQIVIAIADKPEVTFNCTSHWTIGDAEDYVRNEHHLRGDATSNHYLFHFFPTHFAFL